MHEQVLRLPGDPDRPVSLEVTFYTPTGSGPFPLAVLNHGATNASARNRGERSRFSYLAYYFLSRGYAVAMPMQRGFAGSGGEIPHLGCNIDDVGLRDARDLSAVIDGLSQRPDIDGSRIVVGGQSFGGWNSLALATMPPAGVHGVVAFVPALRSSDCRQQEDAMVNRVSRFGAQNKLPSIWFFGENDSVVPTATWHRMFEGYNNSGGKAELVAFGVVNGDSHQLLSALATQRVWAPKVDAFLARIGMPSTPVHPEYMPRETPPPSHFAAIDDLDNLPVHSEAMRNAYRKFLDHTTPRAFVFAGNGGAVAEYGGFDALSRAMQKCASLAQGCAPYAIDSEVVWQPGKSSAQGALPPIRRAVPSGQRTVLVFSATLNPDCTVEGLTGFRALTPPAHGKIENLNAHGHTTYPPADPHVACNANVTAGKALTYQSAPGYAGLEQMTVEETYPNGSKRVLQFELDVRPQAQPPAPVPGR